MIIFHGHKFASDRIQIKYHEQKMALFEKVSTGKLKVFIDLIPWDTLPKNTWKTSSTQLKNMDKNIPVDTSISTQMLTLCRFFLSEKLRKMTKNRSLEHHPGMN